MQFITPNGGRRDITIDGARRLIKDIGNGPFNPKKLECYKTDRSKAVNTVEALRAGVLEAFDDAIKRMARTRVVEISEAPGAAPAGISGVAVDTDDDVDAGVNDTAVVKIQREQHILAVRRVNAEVAEREATTRVQNATALERELASKLLQHQLAQAERHVPLIDAKVAAETEAAVELRGKASQDKAAAAAAARDADAKAKLTELELEHRRTELRLAEEAAARDQARKDADAAEELRLKREAADRKRKLEDDSTAEAWEAKAKEARDAAWDSVNAQLKLYRDASESDRFAMKPGIRFALNALLKEETPDEKKRTARIAAILRIPTPKKESPPPPPEPAAPARTVYVRVGINGCPQQYVGETANLERRTMEHDGGVAAGGAAVVERYNLCLHAPPITPPRDDVKVWENEETYVRMTLYGVDNVFGGKYAAPYRSAEKRLRAIADCCDTLNLCNRCARKGHMFSRCRETTYADWTGGGIITKPITD